MPEFSGITVLQASKSRLKPLLRCPLDSFEGFIRETGLMSIAEQD